MLKALKSTCSHLRRATALNPPSFRLPVAFFCSDSGDDDESDTFIPIKRVEEGDEEANLDPDLVGPNSVSHNAS